MQNKEKKKIGTHLDTNFVLIDLKIKATNIQNCYTLQRSIESLMNFIGTKNLRCNSA